MYKNSAGDAKVRHMMTNVIYRIEGDRRRAACYLPTNCKNGKASLEAIGLYEDELGKVNGRVALPVSPRSY